MACVLSLYFSQCCLFPVNHIFTSLKPGMYYLSASSVFIYCECKTTTCFQIRMREDGLSAGELKGALACGFIFEGRDTMRPCLLRCRGRSSVGLDPVCRSLSAILLPLCHTRQDPFFYASASFEGRCLFAPTAVSKVKAV